MANDFYPAGASDAVSFASMIVHLNGMPGAGKLTVARRLAAMLPARLIDNHLVIDLVTAVCDRKPPQYGQMISAVTAVVYDFVARSCRAEEIVIFTNALAKDVPEDEARLAAVRSLAARMGSAFVPVLLSCDAAENERRLQMPDRISKGKLANVDDLRQLIARYQIAHDSGHPNALEIDTTHLTADETAARIAAHLRGLVAAGRA
jgi:predicted kinase